MPFKLTRLDSEIWTPDGTAGHQALARTTHLAIGAHADDVELMAVPAVLDCFGRDDRALSVVVMTDGSGGPRAGMYRDLTNQEMSAVRRREQKKAAVVGEYASLVWLGYPSHALLSSSLRQEASGQKDAGAKESAGVSNTTHEVAADLEAVLSAVRPGSVVYTHALTDAHDTHVATALRVVSACRRLDPARRPSRLLGCEVWRGLDWLPAPLQVRMDAGERPHLQAALIGVFDSQITAGKRYDLAALGLRRARATYSTSHEVDEHEGVALAMDMTQLIEDKAVDPAKFASSLIRAFEADVLARIARIATEDGAR